MKDEDSPLQADARTIVALVIALAVGTVASAAGVGGGALYVPLFNGIIGFGAKPSTALSQACMVASAGVQVAINLGRRRPADPMAPLIDYPMVLVLVPAMLVGVGIGVLLNSMLPSIVITVLQLALLSLMAVQVWAKGRILWNKESALRAEQQAAAAGAEPPAAALGCSDPSIKHESQPHAERPISISSTEAGMVHPSAEDTARETDGTCTAVRQQAEAATGMQQQPSGRGFIVTGAGPALRQLQRQLGHVASMSLTSKPNWPGSPALPSGITQQLCKPLRGRSPDGAGDAHGAAAARGYSAYAACSGAEDADVEAQSLHRQALSGHSGPLPSQASLLRAGGAALARSGSARLVVGALRHASAVGADLLVNPKWAAYNEAGAMDVWEVDAAAAAGVTTLPPAASRRRTRSAVVVGTAGTEAAQRRGAAARRMPVQEAAGTSPPKGGGAVQVPVQRAAGSVPQMSRLASTRQVPAWLERSFTHVGRYTRRVPSGRPAAMVTIVTAAAGEGGCGGAGAPALPTGVPPARRGQLETAAIKASGQEDGRTPAPAAQAGDLLLPCAQPPPAAGDPSAATALSSISANGLKAGPATLSLDAAEDAEAEQAAVPRCGCIEWLAGVFERTPWRHVGLLLAAWGVYMGLQVARSRQPRCSPAWCVLLAVQLTTMAAMSIGVVLLLKWQAKGSEKASAAGATALLPTRAPHKPAAAAAASPGAAATAPATSPTSTGASDAHLVLRAPVNTLAWTALAGLAGGMLSGGMVMGPLMLHMGVQPMVSAANCGALVLFASSAALLQYALLGQVNEQYALVFGAVSMVAAAAGVLGIASAIRRWGRPSLVVFSLSAVIGIGCVLVAVFGMSSAIADISNGAALYTNICEAKK